VSAGRRARGRQGPPGEAAEALVLDGVDVRDDRVVTLWVQGRGRLRAAARGGRKSARRFGAHIAPLTRAEVKLRSRPDWELGRLEWAEAREVFAVLKADLRRLALGTTMAEVILHLLPEHDDDPALYALTLRAWRSLDDPKRRPSEDLLLLFELRALALTGFLPPWDQAADLSAEARAVLTGWQDGRWAPLPPGARRAVAAFLEGAVCEASGRPLRSRPFLDEVLPR